MASPLLDEDFMRRLEQLNMVSRKIFAGRLRGERRSKRRGVSVEFADYRDYAPGDDLRFLDWNIYSRLERLFLKLFLEEEDLHVYVLIDASDSMAFGSPSKLDYAKKVAAAIAYIGLANLDRVAVSVLSGQVRHIFGPSRGKRQAWRLFSTLEGTEAAGETALGPCCRDFAIRHRHKGVVILISDFLDPQGYEEALRLLLSRNFDIFALHVLCREEIQPSLAGDLRLVDTETGDVAEVTMSGPLLSAYRKRLQRFVAGLKAYCVGHGISYLYAATDVPFDRLVFSYLRRGGLLK